MPRKQLHPDCKGGIFCEVAGHQEVIEHGNGRRTFRHIKLTKGQRETLRERRAAARNG